jgi:hypothetical protein
MIKKILLASAILISEIAHSQVSSGLVAKYSFNNGNANDEIGTNHGTVNGAILTTDRFGNPNRAYSFTNGEYITLPDNPSVKSPVMTVSMWVKIDGYNPGANNQNFIYSIVNSKTNAYFGAYAMCVYSNTGDFLSVNQNNPSQNVTGISLNSNSGNWQHYVLSMDNDSLKMYIDAQKQWSYFKGFTTTYSSDSVYIGASGSTTYAGFLNGSVDDIRVYDRELTASEVTTLFNEPNPVVSITSGLVAKYTFNNTNTNDEIGTHHLTAENGATFGFDRFGNSNKAALLDGNDDYLRTTNSFFYPGNDFSISLWYKSNNLSQSRQTFFNTQPHEQISVGYNWFGNDSYDIALNGGSAWNICSNAANGLDTFFVNGVTETNWNHFVMTYDGTTWNSYINNSLENTCNTGVPTSTVSDLFFGAISVGPQSFFAGLLDDINIYDRALTPSEVSVLYNEQDPASVGVFENMINNTLLKIYPNPNNGEFTIKSKLTDDLVIANELGQIIKEIKLNGQNSFSYHCNDLQNGIYFLIGKSVKQKIIVSK